jgi:hypothetical protein
LGDQAFSTLEAKSRLGSLEDPLIRKALERTNVAWVALRLGLPPDQTDNVLVLEGDFAQITPKSADWTIATDLGAGWRYRDKKSSVARHEASRLYTFVDETWLFVSEAEIDATDRRLAAGAASRRLEVPERGLVSLAASMPALARALGEASPKAARLLQSGRQATAVVDLGAGGVELFATFEFRDAERAGRTGQAAELLLAALGDSDGWTGKVAGGARVETLDRTVTLRLALNERELAPLVGCSDLGDCQKEAGP